VEKPSTSIREERILPYQPLLIHHPGDFRAVFSLPLNASIRGPQYLKPKEKAKNVDSRLKISGMTEGDGCLIKDFRHDG